MFLEKRNWQSNLGFEEYKIYKKQVIEIFEKYKELRGNLEDGIDIKSLENKINCLKNNQFLIAVAGEVKAGKSTFINSLIREELLPVDVLQTTNTLIEIFYSEIPCLKITYASGRIELFENQPKEVLKKILKSIVSIPDEYRDIPTALIDLYIIEHDNFFIVNEEFIKYLEEKSGIKNLKELKYKIELYLITRSKDNIPVRIELGYPLPWKFDEIRIVDMPGVNAIGGVSDLAFSFLEKANAILFIHPIKPVESESFRKFVSSVITNKSKEVLFLIFTHSAVFFEERNRLLEEAKRIYSSIIIPNRIFVVDSILKLIYEELKRGKTLDTIKKEAPDKKKWIVYFKDLAEEMGLDEKEAFIEYSGFKELMPALENFLVSVSFSELINILKKIENGYKELSSIYRETIELLQTQKRNKSLFLEEVEKMQKGLKQLEVHCYLILEEAAILFTGVYSPIEKTLNNFKFKYYNLFLKTSQIEELRKYYRDAENELNYIVKENLNKISNFFKNKFHQIGEQLKEEYHIKIPKIDFSAIEESCKKEVIKHEEVIEEKVESLFENWNFLKPWKWLKRMRIKKVIIENREEIDKEAFFKILQNLLIKTFVEVVEKLRNEFYRAFDFYKNKVKEILKNKRNYLENLKNELKSIEKIDLEILMLEKNIVLIEEEIKKIKKILNRIKQ